MTRLLTPSTGATRDAGAVDFNGRKLRAPQRVLFKSSLGGWLAADIGSVSGTGLTLVLDGKPFGSATFRDVAGTIPAGVDEAALIANLQALERRGDEGMAAARKAKHDALRVLLDHSGLEQVADHVPGM